MGDQAHLEKNEFQLQPGQKQVHNAKERKVEPI